MVGGTGLYLKVLRFGLFAGPPRDPALRAELAEEEAEPGALHARLARVDPATAARLHPHDRVRARARPRGVRADRPADQRLAGRARASAGDELAMRVVGLDVPRAELYARLDARCEAMLAAGLLDEVRALWARGYGPELPALRSIGYREIGAHLRGEVDLATALAAMQRATRQFAKRQLTWFRADPTVQWVAADTAVHALV